jgi:hypothetical protein
MGVIQFQQMNLLFAFRKFLGEFVMYMGHIQGLPLVG